MRIISQNYFNPQNFTASGAFSAVTKSIVTPPNSTATVTSSKVANPAKIPTHAVVYSAAAIALAAGTFFVGKGRSKDLTSKIKILAQNNEEIVARLGTEKDEAIKGLKNQIETLVTDNKDIAEKLKAKELEPEVNLKRARVVCENEQQFEIIENLQQKFVDSKKSVISFIEDINAAPQQIKEFLFAMTSDEVASQKFIKEVVANPREHEKITNTLLIKIGGEKDLLEWIFAPKGYQKAYEKYVSTLVQNAKSADELIKISPNWDYNLLKNKFSDYALGTLPSGFKDADSFRNIVSKLHKNEPLPNGIKLCGEVGFSASGKGHAVVEVNDKKYLIKFRQDYSQYDSGLAKRMQEWPDFSDRMNELAALKSDSTFINAQIDGYLNANQCKNAVGMHFYDSKSQASIYEFIEKFSPHNTSDLISTDADLSDLRKLGLTYNDLNEGNLVKVGDNIKILDSGETEFSDILRPGCPTYNFILPNLCGRSLQNSAAAITLAKLQKGV